MVVANAGINGVWAPIDDLSLEEWNKTISVNFTGTFLTIFTSVPHLKVSGGGSVTLDQRNQNVHDAGRNRICRARPRCTGAVYGDWELGARTLQLKANFSDNDVVLLNRLGGGFFRE
ncbi:SDR family NAD(P)-dependent oxidoreductase [Pararhizobium qamdonense]|uniref:SDR family NAD(P)-dependent oxidoreductase n=1 Tax=Pararhizobium qamdonense TaxID=3031126 RepID=UPI0023E21183|nr:SDR family NAD(P)-dependent oxidoreductase [Pararhizobium qamdonense]